MSSPESVTLRASAIQIRKCPTRRTLGSQVYRRNCRNEKFPIVDPALEPRPCGTFSFDGAQGRGYSSCWEPAIRTPQSTIRNLIMEGAPTAPRTIEAAEQE